MTATTAHSDSRLTLDGLVVIVTGGGNGIGRATALLCAARGAAVAVADLRSDAAERVAYEAAELGAKSVAVQADISNESDVEQMIAQTVDQLGPLYGIVNNAGMIVTRDLVSTSLAVWEATMAVNARGVFLGCRAAVRQFLSTGTKGAIVNTGSISASVGLAGQPAYCASKGAVLQLSRQIAVDYARDGIRCNVVSPGSVTTNVLTDYLQGQSDPDAAEDQIVAAHPIGRLADPQEIAEAICFALAPASSFITGANIAVDGGYTAQ